MVIYRWRSLLPFPCSYSPGIDSSDPSAAPQLQPADGVEEFHLGRKPPGHQRRFHHPRVGALASQQSARIVSRQPGSRQHTYLCQSSHQVEL